MLLVLQSLNPGMNVNLRMVTIKNHEIGEARNWIAEQAVNMNSKYLFFLDEDVRPPAHALRQLITRMEWNPKAAAFLGIYCHKMEPCSPMVFRGNGNFPFWDFKAGEIFQISGGGLGCALIRTEIFTKISSPPFKTIDDASGLVDGINSVENWTEDLVFFSKIAKEAPDYEVWADANVLCEHLDAVSGKSYFLPPGSPPFRRVGVEYGTKKILDIGSGELPYTTDEGEVVTFDIREEVGADYRGDARCLPFATGEFSICRASHILEHFMRDEWEKVLDEWCRVLKPDGEFRLIVPNVLWALEEIKKGLTPQNKEHVLNVLYGSQNYETNKHFMGFTPQIVKEAFEKRGFDKVDIKLSGYHIVCNAFRKVFDQRKKVVTPKKKVVTKNAKKKKTKI
jgi:predicted SAM-dependent methyltransferase